MESECLGSSVDEVPELHELLQLAAHQGPPLVGLVLVILLHGVHARAGVRAQGEREAIQDPVKPQLPPPHLPRSLLYTEAFAERKHPFKKAPAFP